MTVIDSVPIFSGIPYGADELQRSLEIASVVDNGTHLAVGVSYIGTDKDPIEAYEIPQSRLCWVTDGPDPRYLVLIRRHLATDALPIAITKTVQIKKDEEETLVVASYEDYCEERDFVTQGEGCCLLS